MYGRNKTIKGEGKERHWRHRHTQDFTMEGVHVVETVLGSGDFVPQKLEQNVKLVYKFLNLGFNEYRSRAWTVYFANTQFKKKF